MVKSKEERIGIKVTLTALVIWVLASVTLFTISAGVVPIDNFSAKGLLKLFIVILSTIFWGARAGKEIIKDNKHDDLTGIKTVFIILLTFLILTFLFDGDFSEIMENKHTLTNAAKGLLFYIFIQLIPTIITGIIIGRRIKKLGHKIMTQQFGRREK